jgi:putative membrane protein
MKLIIRLAINVFALFVVAYLVPGFKLAGIQTAIVAAIVIGIVNTLIKPVLQLIALPISLLTFGIAAFLINVGLLYMTSKLVPGFEIANFVTAMIGSVVLSLTSWFLNKLASE